MEAKASVRLYGKRVMLPDLVAKLQRMHGGDGVTFFDTYTSSSLLQMLDQDKIEVLEKFFSEKPCGVDVVDFVKIMLALVEHSADATLHVAIALIDLFKELSRNTENRYAIYLQDLTNRICEVSAPLPLSVSLSGWLSCWLSCWLLAGWLSLSLTG